MMFIYLCIIGITLSLLNFNTIKEYLENKQKYMRYRRVNLLLENKIFIKGEITKNSINKTIDELNKNIVHKNINFIIDSEGGNLLGGYDLINKISSLQKKSFIFNCYAINAKSTAFTIFQYCDNRYVIPTSVLFQHNATLEFKGSFEEFELFFDLYFDSYRFILDKLNKDISKRIGMKYIDYKNKIWNDWTIVGGEKIIENNFADEIIILTNYDYYKKK